jgi:1-acyl-sn-glycerol-3-phosphate acyltransferase
MVGTSVRKFAEGKPFSIAITPEGTRKPTKRWKSGFWKIAHNAEVPIVPTYIDFKKKEIGAFDTIWPTDDYEADLLKVRKLYHKQLAKHPEKFIEI